MSRLLVTGGAGFIGANFVHHWIGSYPQDRVVVLDALTYAGNLSNLAAAEGHAGYRFVHGDIRDQALVEALLREEAIDTLVHFAAETHVDRSIVDPDAFLETNVIGTHSLLKAARQVWLEERGGRPHRFHHVSTDEVYGSLGPKDPPFTERSPYAPNSPYAASKAASDHLVRAYAHTYGLMTTISNCSNNYGPFQFPEKLVPLVIVNILRGKQVPIYGDGKNVRDWLHVQDHCRAIELVLNRGRAGETYNVGSGAGCDNLAVVDTLCGIIDRLFQSNDELILAFPDAPPARKENSRRLIKLVADRAGHDRRYAMDATKLTGELNFRLARSLDQGLGETVTWYVEHRDWWERVSNHSCR